MLVHLLACALPEPAAPPASPSGPTPDWTLAWDPATPTDPTYGFTPTTELACVSGREVGFPLRSTALGAEAHALALTRVADDRFEVTGAPDGSVIELLRGSVADSCTPTPDGGCLWVSGAAQAVTTVGGVAAFQVDPAGGAALQARDPATNATSGLYRVAPPEVTGWGTPLDGVGPAGTYDGFSGVSLSVWAEAGDRVIVRGLNFIDDPVADISVPDGSAILAQVSHPYDADPYFEAMIGDAGWVGIGLGTAGWYSGTTLLDVEVTPSLRAWYADRDGDGDGDPTDRIDAVLRPAGRAGSGTDCNDAEPEIYGGAGEWCGDGIDSDCDGADAVCSTLGDPLSAQGHPSVSGTGRAEVVGDLDGDGFEDLALASGSATLLTSATRGDLCLAPIGPAYAQLWGEPLADDDGDGADSLLVPGDEGVWLFRGVPTDDPSATPEWVPGSFGPYVDGFHDLTGDGLGDFALVGPDDGDPRMFGFEGPFSSGDSPFVTWAGAFGGVMPLDDLDGDGIAEIGLADTSAVWVGFGPQRGLYVGRDEFASILSEDPALAGLLGSDDADGDGDADLVTGAGPHFATEVSASRVVDYGNLDPSLAARDVVVVSGDAFFIAAADPFGWETGLYRIEGPLAGTHAASEAVLIGPGVATLEASDLDRDGAEDLLLFGGETATVVFGY
jgi:hypothetical protein